MADGPGFELDHGDPVVTFLVEPLSTSTSSFQIKEFSDQGFFVVQLFSNFNLSFFFLLHATFYTTNS